MPGLTIAKTTAPATNNTPKITATSIHGFMSPPAPDPDPDPDPDPEINVKPT
jgi:hypothetical protein